MKFYKDEDGQLIVPQRLIPYHFTSQAILLFFLKDDAPSALLLMHSALDVLTGILKEEGKKSVTHFTKGTKGNDFIDVLRKQANFLKHPGIEAYSMRSYIEVEFIFNFIYFCTDFHNSFSGLPKSFIGLYKILNKLVAGGVDGKVPPSGEDIWRYVGNFRKNRAYLKLYVFTVFQINNKLFDKVYDKAFNDVERAFLENRIVIR